MQTLITIDNADFQQLADYLAYTYGYDDIDFIALSLRDMQSMITEFNEVKEFEEFSND
jgi:hypothetical protein